MVDNCSKRNSNWEIDDWMVLTEVKISMKKEWFIWKFWKKGGSREKGGGGNEIHAPCACG